MVLIRYGINENRLRVWEKVDWEMVDSDCNLLHQKLLAIRNQ